MKNPFKQMKQVQGAMTVMMYEIYLAGIENGAKGAKFPSLKEFAAHAKELSAQGKSLAGGMMHGRREAITTAEKKSG